MFENFFAVIYIVLAVISAVLTIVSFALGNPLIGWLALGLVSMDGVNAAKCFYNYLKYKGIVKN